MILNQNNQIRNYYIFHHELPNRFHCCSSPESTRRNCPAGHYAVVLRDSHTVVSIISPTWLISPRRQRGPQLWERCVVRWQFTVTAEIKRQLFISRELFSPGVLLIIIFLSDDFYLSGFTDAEGRFLSCDVAPARREFSKNLFTSERRSRNHEMLSYLTVHLSVRFCSGGRIKLKEHVENTLWTLMSLSNPDSPQILCNNK